MIWRYLASASRGLCWVLDYVAIGWAGHGLGCPRSGLNVVNLDIFWAGNVQGLDGHSVVWPRARSSMGWPNNGLDRPLALPARTYELTVSWPGREVA
jgi:hypothetical protein